MGRPQVPIDPVADLRARLGREPSGAARALRPLVRTWWRDHGLDKHPATVGKRVAIALIEQSKVEEKLAGILVLQDQLGTQLRASDLPGFARLFADHHLAEWNVVDWFVMRVLVTLLDRPQGRREAARMLAQWRAAETVWQRRAGCLAFIKLAPQGDAACPGLVEYVFAICAAIVWSIEKHDQTAVGCVLRELARAEPAKVEAFFRRHALLMSKECARYTVAKLPQPLRAELLAHHKRVTSLKQS